MKIIIVLKFFFNFMKKVFKTPCPKINCKNTNTKEIENIIKSLKSKNSFGYDEIFTKSLKISSPFITSPLNYRCNKMFLQEFFLIA
jgi:hypothetical protein